MDERGVDFEDVPDIDLNTYSKIRIERIGRPSAHSGPAYEARTEQLQFNLIFKIQEKRTNFIHMQM